MVILGLQEAPTLTAIAALLALSATLIGGTFALWLRAYAPVVFGFSAGAVIAVAFFDLLPEAMSLGVRLSPRYILALAAAGCFGYVVLDRLLLANRHSAHAQVRGWAGAASLCAHSVVDGLMLGWSFRASVDLGSVVAFAILMHDFSDGINTVGILLRHGAPRREIHAWLALDALAPILGVLISLIVVPDPTVLQSFLAVFGGCFLYIGFSQLQASIRSSEPSFPVFSPLMTLVGGAFIYTVTHFSH
jgi:ZIP family zinc transporter